MRILKSLSIGSQRSSHSTPRRSGHPLPVVKLEIVSDTVW